MLKKLFIKNYKDIENPEVRNRYGTVSGFFGIVTNIILFVIKFSIGLFTNSITIMADAFNNLSDSSSCIVTIIGFKLASKPADKEHPYGHARYEYISGIIISFLILSMGVIFAKSSIEKIFIPEEINLSIATYVILIIAIFGKIIQMMVYLDFSNSIHSSTIKTAAMDSRNDIITTLSVLIGIVVMGIFNINIDGYMGLIVSIFIIISAINSLRETIDPLLGIVPSPEKIEEIKNKILNHEQVKGIHDLMIHNYGVGNDFVTVHAEVSATMNILDAHNLADKIEREFKQELNIDLTIHIDPLELDDEQTINVRKKIKKILEEFDEDLQIHDFRLVKENDVINVEFDILMSFEKKYTKQELIDLLIQNFNDGCNEYHFIINLDRPFY